MTQTEEPHWSVMMKSWLVISADSVGSWSQVKMNLPTRRKRQWLDTVLFKTAHTLSLLTWCRTRSNVPPTVCSSQLRGAPAADTKPAQTNHTLVCSPSTRGFALLCFSQCLRLVGSAVSVTWLTFTGQRVTFCVGCDKKKHFYLFFWKISVSSPLCINFDQCIEMDR